MAIGPSPVFLDSLADAAAAAILPLFRTRLAIEDKGKAGFDPVTLADRAGSWPETTITALTLAALAWAAAGAVSQARRSRAG